MYCMVIGMHVGIRLPFGMHFRLETRYWGWVRSRLLGVRVRLVEVMVRVSLREMNGSLCNLSKHVCVVYLQSSVSLLDTVAEFLKQRVFLLLWILQQLTVVLIDNI